MSNKPPEFVNTLMTILDRMDALAHDESPRSAQGLEQESTRLQQLLESFQSLPPAQQREITPYMLQIQGRLDTTTTKLTREKTKVSQSIRKLHRQNTALNAYARKS